MFQKTILVITTVLALAAAVICQNLLNKHVTGSSGVGWFEAGCSDQAGSGKANCAKVLASPYSYFPPKRLDTPDGRPHFPTAYLGLAYYSAIVIWLIGVGRPSYERRLVHLLPLILVGAGLAGSAYFTFIMYRVLGEWCLWCLVTHILNVLIAVGLIVLWPRRASVVLPSSATSPNASGEGTREFGIETRSLVRVRPSARAVILTGLVIVLAAYSHLEALGLKTWRQQTLATKANFDACVEAINRIKGDADRLVKNWQLAEPRQIARRVDDPVRTFANPTTGPMLDVVVFSDFECPSCQRFAEFFEQRVPPLFDGHVQLTFKHYPIDQTCNPRAGQTMHRYACFGASLAEGARRVAGNDAFWNVHDFLYKHRSELAGGKMTFQRVAESIGVDAKGLQEAAQSADFGIRVSEDVEQARACGIRGTPSVFVEGRPVDMLAVTELGFWDKLADNYWLGVKKPRPASTRPVESAATPSSPGPTTAP